jgi:RNA polymerase sigma-70 factor (ECF subfamily)
MCAGDQPARDLLIEVVYTELHRIARGYLRKERPDHTLQPTALVHEAYLKLFHGAEIGFENRAHFFAVVSQAVRRILVDHARARVTARRDAGIQADWDTSIDVGTDQRYDLLDLDLALDALARDKPPLARLIEMRYFGGMTAEQSAEVLGRSVHMVRHDLRLALAWLRRELAQQET